MYETYIRKTAGITFMDLKQEWIIIWPKIEEEDQRANFPFMFLIEVKEITDNQRNQFLNKRHAFLKSNSSLESLETLFHKKGYDKLSNSSTNIIH